MTAFAAPVVGDTGSSLASQPRVLIIRHPNAALCSPDTSGDESRIASTPRVTVIRAKPALSAPFDPGPPQGYRFVVPSTIAFG